MSELVLACAFACSCTTANGGAVDLSWTLRPQSGTTDPNIPSPFVDCGLKGNDSTTPLAGPVEWIELDWAVGAVTGQRTFCCYLEHGVTTFDLPQGTASLSVVPLCGDGNPAEDGTYVAPAPVLRSVTEGATITLGAVELIVDVASNETDCSGGSGTTPCICANIPIDNHKCSQ
ncbi:MAG TPA: hypothetical protein VMJ10_08700 [Kofleriaceae bacterium]|nr:hypothetical protein [Kofleriaceae bacterium]